MGTLGNAFSNATKSTLTPDERIGWPKAPATPDDGIGMPKAPAKAPQPMDSTKVPVFSNTELTAEQIDLLLKSAHEPKVQAPTAVNYAIYVDSLQNVSDSMSLSENTKNWLLAQEALGNIPIKEGETKSFMLPETMGQDMQDYIKTHEGLEVSDITDEPDVTAEEPDANDRIGGIFDRVHDIGEPTPVLENPDTPIGTGLNIPNDIGMNPQLYPASMTLNEEQTRILLERFANHQFLDSSSPQSTYMNMNMMSDVAPNLGLDNATYMWIASQLQSNPDFKVPFPEGVESIGLMPPASVAKDISEYMQSTGHGNVDYSVARGGNTYEDLVRSGFKMPEASNDDIDYSGLANGYNG